MNTSHIHFKSAVDDADLTDVANLALTIWNEYYTPIIGQKQVDYMINTLQNVEAFKDQISHDYSYFLIINDNINAGYLAIRPEEKALFLSKLYILKEFRHQGISKLSFEFMRDFAKQRNLNKIYLTVNKYNTSSIKAYNCLGFNIVDSIVSDIGGGFVMDDYILEKEL